MSQQGLQAEEIAHIMTTRGMALKKGASTIARLQTVWKLRGDDESRIKNKRYLSRRKAREQQIEEFKNYAVDLGLENPKDWIRKKMEEPAVKQMRHEAACELMGDDAPTLRSLGEKGRPRKLRGGQFGQIANGTQASAAQAVTRLEGLSHDEDSAADAPPVTRTLRSKRVSRNDTDVALEQMERQDTEEESSDANSDYDHMDGVDQSNNQIIGFHDGNRYYPMMEQDDDDDDLDENDDDDEKQESTAHQPHNVQSQNPAMHPSAGITNATMALVPPAEEQDSIKRLMGTADGCIAAAQLLKDLLQAQSEGRPAPRSLSGLPPSVKDIDVARRKLREAVQSTATFM